MDRYESIASQLGMHDEQADKDAHAGDIAARVAAVVHAETLPASVSVSALMLAYVTGYDRSLDVSHAWRNGDPDAL